MTKKSNNTVELSDAEVDELMLHLEAINAETGNPRVFKIMEILMKDTVEAKIQELSDNHH